MFPLEPPFRSIAQTDPPRQEEKTNRALQMLIALCVCIVLGIVQLMTYERTDVGATSVPAACVETATLMNAEAVATVSCTGHARLAGTILRSGRDVLMLCVCPADIDAGRVVDDTE